MRRSACSKARNTLFPSGLDQRAIASGFFHAAMRFSRMPSSLSRRISAAVRSPYNFLITSLCRFLVTKNHTRHLLFFVALPNRPSRVLFLRVMHRRNCPLMLQGKTVSLHAPQGPLRFLVPLLVG